MKIESKHIVGILKRAGITITEITYKLGSPDVGADGLPGYIADSLNEDMAIVEGMKNLTAVDNGAYLEYKTISNDVNEEMVQLITRCKHTLCETRTTERSVMVVCKICGTILEQETCGE